MDSLNSIGRFVGREYRKYKVHHILAQSYSVFFIFFLIGVACDLIFQLKIFKSQIMLIAGLLFLVFASLLILWAQKTSRNLKEHKKAIGVSSLTKENFLKGPYRWARSPTHWGLFLLVLGFGLVANAVFVVLFAIIAFFVTRMVFVNKEEAALVEKYGAPYLEYKKLVKF